MILVGWEGGPTLHQVGQGAVHMENSEKAYTVGSKVWGKYKIVWVKRNQGRLLLLVCNDGTIEIYKVPSLSRLATIKSPS